MFFTLSETPLCLNCQKLMLGCPTRTLYCGPACKRAYSSKTRRAALQHYRATHPNAPTPAAGAAYNAFVRQALSLYTQDKIGPQTRSIRVVEEWRSTRLVQDDNPYTQDAYDNPAMPHRFVGFGHRLLCAYCAHDRDAGVDYIDADMTCVPVCMACTMALQKTQCGKWNYAKRLSYLRSIAHTIVRPVQRVIMKQVPIPYARRTRRT